MFPFVSNKGILGLNARNLLYIKPYNPRKAVALADDKLKTKAFLAARGVPVAKIYARIESRDQLRAFDFKSLPDECVLKPNNGFGGEGIIILKGRKNGQFLEQGKQPISDEKLREHIEDILDGKFSINGREDTAFFEKILVTDRCFAPFHPAGLPDIRIVVFNLVPVMAMLRIPTVESGGKANVHQGGIGIGIDLSKGTTTYATQYNKIIHRLPHGGSPSGIAIPGWEEILLIASRIQYNTNIGYLAVDLTIDADMGPALLEVNARAGLMVQIANLAPLRARLERVAGIDVNTPEKGVRLAQDLFGQKKRASHQELSEDDRPVLGTHEMISIAGIGATVDVPALLSAEHERTVFSSSLLTELQSIDGAIKLETEEEGYRVKFALGGRKIQTIARIGDVPSDVRAIVGRRDLSGFLIDPVKTQSPVASGGVKEDLRAIDRFLASVDHDLLLLKYVKPENLFEERARAVEDRRYNPIFQYAPVQVDMNDIEGRLIALSPDDSALGLLLRKKRRELLQRITVLRSRGNARAFTDACSAMYGQPTSVLLSAATSVLRSQQACDLPRPENMLTAEQVVPMLEEVLSKYGLHDWRVDIRDSVVARITVGSQSVYLRRDAMFPKEDIQGLIAHEIETHALTSENGSHQPFELFRRGFAQYMDTQEGLAVYNQNRFLSPHHEKRYGPARNILGTAFALEHSFADTRRYLQEELGYDADKALTKAIDMKRGIVHTAEPGGFTRGIVYFRGLRAIEHFIAAGGDLRRLYVGKIALEDLDLLKDIPGMKEPLILPEFLREDVQEIGKKKRAKKG